MSGTGQVEGSETNSGLNPELVGATDVPDPTPPVEEKVPPVEILEEESPSGQDDGAESGEPEAGEAVPQGLRAKAVDKVEELAARVGEILAITPGELEASRSFSHPLSGENAGWRVMFEVKVYVRRDAV